MNSITSGSMGVSAEIKSPAKPLVTCSSILALVVALVLVNPPRAAADPFLFSTGNVTNQIGIASRPGSPGKLDIEAADDFVLNGATRINQASFTGLIPAGSVPNQVIIEIYHVFPRDSDALRLPNVPTRVNSPSDVELLDRDSAAGELTFTTTRSEERRVGKECR